MNVAPAKRLALLASLMIASTALRIAASPLLIDDAYITFRYARNLESGLGFVYNVGEHVLGTSTPLFTLLLALAAKLGMPVEISGVVIGVVSDALLIVLFVELGIYLNRLWLGIVVSIWIAAYSQIVFAAVSGMETEFYTLLVVASFVFYAKRRIDGAAICGALAALARPEGMLVLVALSGATLLRREWRWQNWVPAVLLLIMWAVFSVGYFGTPIPNSVLAKIAVYPPYEEPWHNFAQISSTLAAPLLLVPGLFLALLVPSNGTGFSLALVFSSVLFGLALAWGIWSTRFARTNAMALWFVLDTLFFGLPNRYLFIWYTTPLYGITLFFALLGLSEVAGRFQVLLPLKISRILGFAIVALMTIVMVIQTFSEIGPQKWELAHREQMYLCIGHELDKLTPQHFIVASPEVGALGYSYAGPILDLIGLISPLAVPYYQAPDFHFHFPHSIPLRLVQDAHPEVLVLFDQLAPEIVGSDWLSRNYRQEKFYLDLHPYYGSLAVYLRNDQDWTLDDRCEP